MLRRELERPVAADRALEMDVELGEPPDRGRYLIPVSTTMSSLEYSPERTVTWSCAVL